MSHNKEQIKLPADTSAGMHAVVCSFNTTRNEAKGEAYDNTFTAAEQPNNHTAQHDTDRCRDRPGSGSIKIDRDQY